MIATDQTAARAYAAILDEITGEAPTVVLSDEKEASARIEEFAAGDEPLDGRGAHGVGGRRRAAARRRRVRDLAPRRRCSSRRRSAASCARGAAARRRSIFLPNVPQLLALATELELERDHALDREQPTTTMLLDDDAAGRGRTRGERHRTS